jgi:hypothetical protein
VDREVPALRGGQPGRFLLGLWWLSTAALFWSRPEPVLLLVKVTFLLATVALWVLSGGSAPTA